jgi:uncharacterized protein
MLLDTSGLFALLHRSESQHRVAAAYYQNAQRRVTHSYVLAELIPLAQARGSPRKPVLEFSNRLLTDRSVLLIWVEEVLHLQALDLLSARPDKNYSLCDAVSFVVMREHGLIDALTTDRHFEQEGFRRLLA